MNNYQTSIIYPIHLFILKEYRVSNVNTCIFLYHV